MVVVVDTNRPQMTECEELLKKSKTIVVLDHHRQSSDNIDNALLSYIEPYASSACEMVSEVLQYIVDDIKIPKIEASSLYAGIMIDTNNFVNRTGVRTFEAAAFLRRCGADPDIVRELFSSDFDTVKDRALILSGAQISDGVAMASCPKGQRNATIIAAQVADMLINIDSVEASFTFYYLADDCIGVSARSKGEINVQLVMEALGGGGHRTVAGAQLRGRTLVEAQGDVMAALHEIIDKDKEIDEK